MRPSCRFDFGPGRTKGNGKWASQVALDLGIPTPVINQSVIARNLSSFKEERKRDKRSFSQRRSRKKRCPFSAPGKALFLSELAAFARVFICCKRPAGEFSYNLNLSEIARIWKGGCILRARILSRIQEALKKSRGCVLISPLFLEKVKEYLPLFAAGLYCGSPGWDSCSGPLCFLSYFDSWKESGYQPTSFKPRETFLVLILIGE